MGFPIREDAESSVVDEIPDLAILGYGAWWMLTPTRQMSHLDARGASAII